MSRKPTPRFRAKYLRKRMLTMGITVDAVADQCSVSRATVNNWFAAAAVSRSTPRAESLAALAIMLDLPMGACMGLEDPVDMDY